MKKENRKKEKTRRTPMQIQTKNQKTEVDGDGEEGKIQDDDEGTDEQEEGSLQLECHGDGRRRPNVRRFSNYARGRQSPRG